MMWRRGFQVVVGALVVLLTGGGCARKEMGVPNTAPIREETTTTPAPVVTEVPTTAVSTTLQSTQVPATDPKPVGDDYRGTVIVKAVPKTDREREILDATVELLAKRRQLQLLNTSDRTLLGEVMTGKALDDYIDRGSGSESLSLVQVPAATDRFVVKSLVTSSPDSAVSTVCEVDGASVFRRDSSGQLVIDHAGVPSTVQWEFQILLASDGWRIGYETVVDVRDGVDLCGN
jgi:hypothetical protein